MEQDFSKLYVGTKVVVRTFGRSKNSRKVGTIVKITPSGLVDVEVCGDVKRFRPNGSQFSKAGTAFRYDELSLPTEGEIEDIEKEDKRCDMIAFILNTNYSEMPYEKIEAIYRAVRSKK